MDEALAPGADRYRPVFLHSAKEVLEVLLRPASGGGDRIRSERHRDHQRRS